MNNKIAGSILFGFSGLVAAIGTVGTQIAYALVKAGFYAGQMTGENPPGPESAAPHWIIVVSIGILAILGVYFLFAPDKSNRKLEQ
jgi:H+/Cl- antiporter ClcA